MGNDYVGGIQNAARAMVKNLTQDFQLSSNNPSMITLTNSTPCTRTYTVVARTPDGKYIPIMTAPLAKGTSSFISVDQLAKLPAGSELTVKIVNNENGIESRKYVGVDKLINRNSGYAAAALRNPIKF